MIAAADHAAAVEAIRALTKGEERNDAIMAYAVASGVSATRILADVEGRDPAPRKNGTTLYAVRASEVEPEAVDWLWRPRIPLGKLTLVVGDPAAGKSTIATLITAHVTRGLPLPGDDAIPAGAVLIISAEDGIADTIRPRLEAAGAVLDRVHIFEGLVRDGLDEPLTLRSPGHRAALDDALASLRPVLVVVDPLTAFLGDTDSHRDAAVRSVVAPLAEQAERYGCAVLAIMHLKKNAGADTALKAVGGSVAFGAAARSVLLAGSDPDDPTTRALVHLKGNVGPEADALAYALVPATIRDGTIDTVLARFTGASDLTAARILARASEAGDGDAVGDAVEFLRAELAAGPVESKSVIRAARAQGIAERTLKRAKSELGIRSSKDGFEGGWRWSLEGGQRTWHPSQNGDLAPFGQAVADQGVAVNHPTEGCQTRVRGPLRSESASRDPSEPVPERGSKLVSMGLDDAIRFLSDVPDPGPENEGVPEPSQRELTWPPDPPFTDDERGYLHHDDEAPVEEGS